MKIINIVAGISLVALGACMSDSEMAEPTVVDPLVGKKLTTENATFIINADGTMGGTLRGEPVVGTYTADATQTCSTYTSPPMLVGKEFCSVPVISGNTVVFNRTDGSTSPAYKIEG